MKTLAAGQEGYAAVRRQTEPPERDDGDQELPGGRPGARAGPERRRGSSGVYLTDIDDSAGLPEYDVDTFLAALDEQDLGEHEVPQVFAAVVEDRLGKPRGRTRQEARRTKAAKKVDLDFFDQRRASKPGFKRLMMSDVKKRTRCANCGERGHWAETCKNEF
eukprot:2498610-Pyramimonas_sp.AAC.1